MNSEFRQRLRGYIANVLLDAGLADYSPDRADENVLAGAVVRFICEAQDANGPLFDCSENIVWPRLRVMREGTGDE